MKVKELIKILLDFDPNQEVKICKNWLDFTGTEVNHIYKNEDDIIIITCERD